MTYSGWSSARESMYRSRPDSISFSLGRSKLPSLTASICFGCVGSLMLFSVNPARLCSTTTAPRFSLSSFPTSAFWFAANTQHSNILNFHLHNPIAWTHQGSTQSNTACVDCLFKSAHHSNDSVSSFGMEAAREAPVQGAKGVRNLFRCSSGGRPKKEELKMERQEGIYDRENSNRGPMSWSSAVCRAAI